tara:strand:- start:449 stop:919 length:471 start_codon:yes stop_codon:yes gene_type:complete
VKSWTREEVETLHQMRVEGKTAAAIGAVLGRSKNSVISRMNRPEAGFQGEKKRSITVETRNRALAADYKGGMTQSQVAAKYAISTSHAARILSRMGVSLHPSEREKRTKRGMVRSPFRPGPAGIPKDLREPYRKLRQGGGLTPPEARQALGLPPIP